VEDVAGVSADTGMATALVADTSQAVATTVQAATTLLALIYLRTNAARHRVRAGVLLPAASRI
jgi:hypothetical protein